MNLPTNAYRDISIINGVPAGLIHVRGKRLTMTALVAPDAMTAPEVAPLGRNGQNKLTSRNVDDMIKRRSI